MQKYIFLPSTSLIITLVILFRSFVFAKWEDFYIYQIQKNEKNLQSIQVLQNSFESSSSDPAQEPTYLVTGATFGLQTGGFFWRHGCRHD